ncbi:hypothetical protein ETB97_006223 [Aspergillus alliaceus]|uniref:Uncharacterized protein n=1 Tax=Petromyces alliaceus TaxID=209559 RepID=A0A8H6A0F5_PETAA|nr:hypothetical protein ETB97_006223 [Aspergillus burnettii]
MPPVPDGSGSAISRVIRFDYADEDYLTIAYEAYLKRSKLPKYNGIFFPTSYILTGNASAHGWTLIEKTTAALTKKQLPWTPLGNAAAAKASYPVLSGPLASPNFTSYCNDQAGWVDSSKAVSQLHDDCLELGVSFICGRAEILVGLDTDLQNYIKAVQTLAGTSILGDHSVLASGAWTSGLVNMSNSALSTAQVIGSTPSQILR